MSKKNRNAQKQNVPETPEVVKQEGIDSEVIDQDQVKNDEGEIPHDRENGSDGISDPEVPPETPKNKKPETKPSGSFVVARGTVKHSGKEYTVGDSISVSDADAKRLLLLGAIRKK